MPDDHSELVPLLPIPNRTVKRLCADDSADTRVKVGHRQAIQPENAPSPDGAFFFGPKFVTGFQGLFGSQPKAVACRLWIYIRSSVSVMEVVSG